MSLIDQVTTGLGMQSGIGLRTPTLGCTFTVGSEEVVVRIPANLTADEIDDVETLFEIMVRQLRRLSVAKEEA